MTTKTNTYNIPDITTCAVVERQPFNQGKYVSNKLPNKFRNVPFAWFNILHRLLGLPGNLILALSLVDYVGSYTLLGVSIGLSVCVRDFGDGRSDGRTLDDILASTHIGGAS